MRAIQRSYHAFVLLMFLVPAKAQQFGNHYITNFTPDVYNASQQNWAIAQDKRGIIYIGNTSGMLTFDGHTWALLKLPIVRAVAIDSAGTVFVGLANDFGYLKADKAGRLEFVSLKAKIPAQQRDFNDVWKIHFLGQQVVFQTYGKIFIFDGNHIKVLSAAQSYHFSFVVHHRLYITELGKGLMFLDGDSLKLLPGAGCFADDAIWAMLPYHESDMLLVTRKQGIVIYSPETGVFTKSARFEKADYFLRKNPASCAVVLGNGDVAAGTITGGIVVVSPDGYMRDVYCKNTGLADNIVYNLWSDKNGQLWAALDYGIALIQNNLPFRIMSKTSGLSGTPMCQLYDGGTCWVGTSQSLYRQNAAGNFDAVPGVQGQCYQLCAYQGSLLLALSPGGIYEVHDQSVVSISKKDILYGLSFCALVRNPGYLLVGTDAGIFVTKKTNHTWLPLRNIKGFHKVSYKLAEGTDGDIWVSTVVEVYKLQVSKNLDNVLSLKRYTQDQGLPSSFAEPYGLHGGEVVFATQAGMYRYNKIKDRFEKHPDFLMLKGKVLPFSQQPNGDIWFEESLENGNHEKGVLTPVNGKYMLNKVPFLKFNDIAIGSECYYTITTAPDSTVVIGTTKGLIQYNAQVKTNYNIGFNTLIRKVYANDSLLFTDDAATNGADKKSMRTALGYGYNHIICYFSATFFEDAEKTQFSYRLVGADAAWSAWVHDYKKEYTNLPEGSYVFEVKSRNQYQHIGNTATYTFQILPPWYRTWWAYGLYLLGAVGLFYASVKLIARQLILQKKRLEKIIEERTEKIVKQNDEIQSQAHCLTEANNKLLDLNATKDKFFSIIAHDLKNPFNSILGFSALLIDELQPNANPDAMFYTKTIHNSAQSAYSLLENLLDWAQSQTRSIKFNPEIIALNDLIASVSHILESTRIAKNIAIEYQLIENTNVFADSNMLHTIMRNLLTNAIKYSYNTGTIRIVSEKEESYIKISVVDNGVGMSADKIAKLFNMREKTSTLGTADEQGTGLGLILCKEFIEKQGGNIWVESQPGQGSRFSFTIPCAVV